MDFKLFEAWVRKVFPNVDAEQIKRFWDDYQQSELRKSRFLLNRFGK